MLRSCRGASDIYLSSEDIMEKTCPTYDEEEAKRLIDGLPVRILMARKRLKCHLLKTPLMYSSYLSKMSENTSVYIKLEGEQITGSCKARGAFNKMYLLNETDRATFAKGIVTSSTGNHALACLDTSRKLGFPLSIYCCEEVTQTKIQTLKENGAKLFLHGKHPTASENKARETAKETGALYLSSYMDIDVIAGQGTIGCEILEELPEVECVLVSVGGGGMISGIARYIKQIKPSVKIVGCQALNARVMYESIKAGKIRPDVELSPTLSDGTYIGIKENSITFPMCRDYVDEWILVDEEQIGRAIIFMLQKHHKVVEGAAGTAIAAYINNADKFIGMNIVIVSCGSNLSTTTLQNLMNKYM